MRSPWLAPALATSLLACTGPSGADEGSDTETSSSENSDTDDPPSSLLEATQVSTGATHACARAVGGELVCWGENGSGQLGIGSTVEHEYPVVADIVGVVEVELAWQQSCARTDVGMVYCWGQGNFGQLGDGSSGQNHSQHLPTKAIGLTDAVDISLSGNSACAVLGDGSVWCWGENELGSLGFESPLCGPFELVLDTLEYYDLPCQAEPAQVPGLTDVVEVAVGGVHQCARHVDGSVSCWGAQNQWGILGDGTSSNPLTVEPRLVEGLSGIVQLEAGWYFTCALDDEGQVWCWGSNSHGALGLGTTYQEDPSRPVPTLVPGLSSIVRISAKNSSVCAIDEQGAVWCWGDTNYLFPIERRLSAVSRAPEPVEFGGAAAVEIDSNGFTTCILDVDDHVRCRGLAVANGSSDWTDYSGDPVLWDPS